MAHFAELNNDNKVIRVIVVANEELLENGVESESKGIAFCENLLGGRWVQTSYNGNFRKNYAGIGYIYDPIKDVFYEEQPFPSWIFDDETCRWNPPKLYPDSGRLWRWDEEIGDWVNGETL